MAEQTTDRRTNLDLGIELAEPKQNEFRDLGSSNYTFFLGQQFTRENLLPLGWRLQSVNVDLNNDHLRNEREVCCIKGNRRYLIGRLNMRRTYIDYYPRVVQVSDRFALEFIPSFALGHDHIYLKETRANEEYNFKAYTIGGNFRLRMSFFKYFFIQAPNVEIGL